MRFVVPDIDLLPLFPAIIPIAVAMFIMLADALTPGTNKTWLAFVALIGVAFAMFTTFNMWGLDIGAFNNSIVADNFALSLSLVVLGATFIAILLSIDFVSARNLDVGEYLALLLATASGMVLMALANDLIIVFLGLELFSLALYVLSAFWRTSSTSLEAGMKYFLLGSFSSSFFLYGIAFIYGATGTTNLSNILAALSRPGAAGNSLFLIGVGLLLVGFGFKVALVPFQWWTPDVYEGAPTPITAFMSVATKTAAFAAFFRAFSIAIPPNLLDWQMAVAALAVLTMVVGNVAALVQTNIKRMLAYSSIAHAGYVSIALVAGTQEGLAAAVFYLFAYAVMNLGAFGAVMAMAQGDKERVTFGDLAGAATQKPWAAAALSICLLSLAGFPPFAGFVGKFFVFGAAVNAGYTWLAVVGVLNSLVSVYYYLGPVIRMYMTAPAESWQAYRTPAAISIAVVITVAATIALGIFPFNVIQFAQAARLK